MRVQTSDSGSALVRHSSIAKIQSGYRLSRGVIGTLAVILALCPLGHAQMNDATPAPTPTPAVASAEEVRQLREVVQSLLVRVTELESELKRRRTTSEVSVDKAVYIPPAPPATSVVTALPSAEAASTAASSTTLNSSTVSSSAVGLPALEIAAPAAVGASKEQAATGTAGNLDFLHGATLNFAVDEYYAYNFNNPVGRVNALRAYDVLSNNISLNQADVVFEKAPDVDAGQRFGVRLDLQFGQATDTLQGNPANEPRPAIYQNIFQAYGTYVAPIGNGLTVDVGKFGSSIGIEGNYTKDQMNYSRAYWFDFLPFYHMGGRAAYKVTDKLTLNYWVVNGTNQAEATNGYKDELFGFTATPTKKLTWNVNYYIGQERPDWTVVSSSWPIPVQPGLTFAAIVPAPNGKLHIFDTYANWQATSKLTFELEGDYVIQRLWQTTEPGESSAPSHAIGGAGYARYQISPKFAVAGRVEYMSDRGGLFSGITQALKETTATFEYRLTEGFLMRCEWRRDFSNQPSFFTDTNGVLSKEQQTATIGLVWWVGKKEGAW